MRVLVTGASGFVGTAVVEELIRRNHSVRALVNRRATGIAVEMVRGSLFDRETLVQAARGCDAIIHLVGIIMEQPMKAITFERVHVQGTQHVIDAARRAGVKRYVHMSALGTRPDAVSTYHKTKFEAEEYVRSSGLDWTIFRPSLIHGARGEFMQMEARWARMKAPPFLFMPYFGAGFFGCRGAGLLQPVYVADVARAFADALEKRGTIGEVYPMAGPDRVTWPQMHHIVSRAVVGRQRSAFPMPVWKAKILANIGIGPFLGFNLDQVIMSQEDNTCELDKFVKDFGWTPAQFEESLKSYVGQL
ncbi:MAG TPA: complex I NDUFA9 subunit family protein [Tepidisphaeraceae bacterium]|nr:complex I NDUFA9 subunit family protein [Tepidisphaeraceae bacterium]